MLLLRRKLKKEIIVQLNKTFEESAYTQNGVEYLMAWDIQKLLDYAEWRNFLLVIDKAKIACTNSGQNISDHFVDANQLLRRLRLLRNDRAGILPFTDRLQGSKQIA